MSEERGRECKVAFLFSLLLLNVSALLLLLLLSLYRRCSARNVSNSTHVVFVLRCVCMVGGVVFAIITIIRIVLDFPIHFLL